MANITIRELKNPTFHGKHNAIRSKCWLILYDRLLAGKSSGLTLSELAEQTGCNYGSLAHLLFRWVRWRYILRSNTVPFTYHIAARGRKWLDRWRNHMPLHRYIGEIEAIHKDG